MTNPRKPKRVRIPADEPKPALLLAVYDDGTISSDQLTVGEILDIAERIKQTALSANLVLQA